MRNFPILSQWQWKHDVLDKTLIAKCPRSIPWDLIAPHEEQAQINHSQSLQRLAERGGLSPLEMYCVMNHLRFRDGKHFGEDNAIKYILELVDPKKPQKSTLGELCDCSWSSPHFPCVNDSRHVKDGNQERKDTLP